MLGLFKKDREKVKEEAVNAMLSSLTDSYHEFNEEEQTEIMNRLGLRVFERMRDRRTQLIKEARMVQDSMKTLKLEV